MLVERGVVGGYVGRVVVVGARVVVGAGTTDEVVVATSGSETVVLVSATVDDDPGAGGSVDSVLLGAVVSRSLTTVVVAPPSDEPGAEVLGSPATTVVVAPRVDAGAHSVVWTDWMPRPAAASNGRAANTDKRVLERRTSSTSAIPTPSAARPRMTPNEPPVDGKAQMFAALMAPTNPLLSACVRTLL